MLLQALILPSKRELRFFHYKSPASYTLSQMKIFTNNFYNRIKARQVRQSWFIKVYCEKPLADKLEHSSTLQSIFAELLLHFLLSLNFRFSQCSPALLLNLPNFFLLCREMLLGFFHLLGHPVLHVPFLTTVRKHRQVHKS